MGHVSPGPPVGSRFLRKNNGIPRYRQLGQKTLDLFTNIGANSMVTDSQSGFRAISCRALEHLDFRSEGYNVESVMINHFSKLGLSIQEVPISVKYDVPHKHKKNPVSHGVGVLTQLINLIGYRRPLLLFGIPGCIFVVSGLVAEIWVFAELYAGGGSFHYVLAIGSAFLLITGMLLVVTGLILNTLLGHFDVSHGQFSASHIDLAFACDDPPGVVDGADDCPQAGCEFPECLHLTCRAWLAPFDFGIQQKVVLRFAPAPHEPGFLEIRVTLIRESGESNAWRRINKGFLHVVRRQLLIWRSLDETAKVHYEQLLAEARRRLKQTADPAAPSPSTLQGAEGGRP